MDENRTNISLVALEVDERNTMRDLAKRFDELFPNTIIRLIINGEYSPMFYLGEGKWAFKPKSKPKKKTYFKCKLYCEDRVDEYMDFALDFLLDKLKISTKYLRLIGDVEVFQQEYNGLIITDGRNIIIDQELVESSAILAGALKELFQCETIYDSSNVKENGIIVLYSPMNILGSEND